MPQITLANLAQFVGKELGVSGWLTVDQSRINQFAECSGDRQWIHVDVERAKRESPYRSPIAHGYLTLSLVAPLKLRSVPSQRPPRRHSITGSTRSAFWHRSRRVPGFGCALCSWRWRRKAVVWL